MSSFILNNLSCHFRSKSGVKFLTPFWIERGADFLFAAGDARLDRIKLQAEVRVGFSPDALEDVLGDINHRDKDVRPDVYRLNNQGPNRWRVSTVQDRWLLNAHGHADLAHPGLLIFNLELDLNLTTFLVHQPSPVITDIQARSVIEAMQVSPAVRRLHSAATLDGNDNVLLGVDYLGSRYFDRRAKQSDALIDTYLGKVRDFLASTLAPADRWAVIEGITFKSITQAEVYWELEHPDAVSWVREFRKPMLAVDSATHVTTYPVSVGGIENAECIKRKITKNIGLKVYAKLGNRVRFEIEFTGRINRSITRAGCPATSLWGKLKELRKPAAKRLKDAWDEVMNLTTIQDNATDICDFMARLNRSVPEPNRRLLLSLLANHRRLSTTAPEGFASATVCSALEREGILIRMRVRKRTAQAQYALAPSWSRMFDRLLDRNDAPPTFMN